VGNRWKLVDVCEVEHWDRYRDDAVVNTPITKASCLYFEISASSDITEVCCFMSHYNHKAHISVACRFGDGQINTSVKNMQVRKRLKTYLIQEFRMSAENLITEFAV
jgi:hypothetical protein